MPRSRISLYLVLLLVMALALPAFAGESHTVASEGVAAIRGNARASARKTALKDAKRRAVEQAISIMLDLQTRIENHQLISDKILSKTEGYIKQYSVTGENVDSGLLRVRIKAQIAFGRLTNDLSAIGILVSRKPKLRSVSITVIGLNKNQFIKFKEVLRNQVRCIKGLQERSFSGTTAKISVDSKNSAQILYNELLMKDFGTFTLEVLSSTANSLELKVTRK